MFGAAAVRTQIMGEKSPPGRNRADYGRSGAVAKEHAGAAIGPVGDPAEEFDPDDQDIPAEPGGDGLRGLGQPVDKARTAGGQIEGRRLLRAEAVLEQAGRGGEDHVRSDRGTR